MVSTAKQLDLFSALATDPEEYDPSFLLDKLPDDSAFNGAVAGAELIGHIAEFGVKIPILVIRVLDDRTPGSWSYAVGDGQRRVIAARKADQATIPALIYPPGTPKEALSLVANNVRSENVASDLAALARYGELSEAEIARLTGIPVSRLRSRLRFLRNLIPALRQGLENGQIRGSVAEAASKLDQTRQHDLAAILAVRGKLTAKDVDAASRVQAQEAADALPDFMFATPEDAGTAAADWRIDVAAHIRQALARVPAGADGDTVRQALEACYKIATDPQTILFLEYRTPLSAMPTDRAEDFNGGMFGPAALEEATDSLFGLLGVPPGGTEVPVSYDLETADGGIVSEFASGTATIYPDSDGYRVEGLVPPEGVGFPVRRYDRGALPGWTDEAILEAESFGAPDLPGGSMTVSHEHPAGAPPEAADVFDPAAAAAQAERDAIRAADPADAATAARKDSRFYLHAGDESRLLADDPANDLRQWATENAPDVPLADAARYFTLNAIARRRRFRDWTNVRESFKVWLADKQDRTAADTE